MIKPDSLHPNKQKTVIFMTLEERSTETSILSVSAETENTPATYTVITECNYNRTRLLAMSPVCFS